MKQFFPLLIFFIIVMALTLGSALLSRPAPPPQVQPLQVGDPVPEIEMEVGDSTFTWPKGKLLIMEFINTHCGTCRKSVPHLQELQQTFNKELTVILITKQNDSLIREVVDKYEWTLPIITEDSTLEKLFPYYTVPHQVWIKDREVVAITDWQYANERNIRELIAGKKVATNFKKDDPIDLSKPLIHTGIQPYYQSVITPRISSGSGIYKSGNIFLAHNSDIKELFRIAYARMAFPSEAYVLTELNDSLRQLIEGPDTHITGYYQQDSAYLAWREQYTYCYNLVYPEGSTIQESQLQQTMQRDLNEFFRQSMGIAASLEKRLIKCLALNVMSNDTSFRTSGGKSSISRANEDYQIINKPISLLIGQIAFRHNNLGMPVINNTGYTGNVDLSFTGNLSDLNSVNEGLAKYGLQFVEQDHEIEVVVLKETIDY